jgi:hypothetical protein
MIGLPKKKIEKTRYYLEQTMRRATPSALLRRRRHRLLRQRDRCDEGSLEERVAYYNRVPGPFELGPDAVTARQIAIRKRRTYAFDLLEYFRMFPPGLRLHCRFGDNLYNPETPTIVKSRPIAPPNENAVLMNLNRVRHFVATDDPLPFREKRDVLVWRGAAYYPNRQWVVERFCDHPLCDVGRTNPAPDGSAPPWIKPRMSIGEQLRCKFILSIEGNDVATNLKWIMSSHSLCFMTEPHYETWFMEGRLEPGVHYVRLEDDYRDLEEKIEYYRRHTGEAEQIVENARAYRAQFENRLREDLIALRVLETYFEHSGQSVGQA